MFGVAKRSALAYWNTRQIMHENQLLERKDRLMTSNKHLRSLKSVDLGRWWIYIGFIEHIGEAWHAMLAKMT